MTKRTMTTAAAANRTTRRTARAIPTPPPRRGAMQHWIAALTDGVVKFDDRDEGPRFATLAMWKTDEEMLRVNLRLKEPVEEQVIRELRRVAELYLDLAAQVEWEVDIVDVMIYLADHHYGGAGVIPWPLSAGDGRLVAFGPESMNNRLERAAIQSFADALQAGGAEVVIGPPCASLWFAVIGGASEADVVAAMAAAFGRENQAVA